MPYWRMAVVLHLDHPGRVAIGATAVLAISTLIAGQDPPPQLELDLTTWINQAPVWVSRTLYPVMQLGTVAAPLGLAAVVLIWKRDRWTAAAAVVGGLVTWFAAKAVKQMVKRGRPLAYLPDLHVREGDGTGLGFISGHSAVAACTALIAMTVLPRRARPWLALAAVLVGVGRIVHGVHLPADVTGGWAFGVLTGMGTILLFDTLRSTTSASSAAR